jgi:homoaconitase/3-isopropylmalate dehydratase large subunit
MSTIAERVAAGGVDRGFNAAGAEWTDATCSEFEALEREWRRVITERRAAA